MGIDRESETKIEDGSDVRSTDGTGARRRRKEKEEAERKEEERTYSLDTSVRAQRRNPASSP